MECGFYNGWKGKCKKQANKSRYCEEHKNVKCVSCGNQATHTCTETFSSMFVCGCLLCNECKHTFPKGEGVAGHCRIIKGI